MALTGNTNNTDPGEFSWIFEFVGFLGGGNQVAGDVPSLIYSSLPISFRSVNYRKDENGTRIDIHSIENPIMTDS